MEKNNPYIFKNWEEAFCFLTHTKCYHGNHSFRQNVPYKKKKKKRRNPQKKSHAEPAHVFQHNPTGFS